MDKFFEYIPENKLILPEDIDIPDFGDQKISSGSEVQYDSYELQNGEFLIILYYKKYLEPLTYVKIPLLFDSKNEAIKLGYIKEIEEGKKMYKARIKEDTHIDNLILEKGDVIKIIPKRVKTLAEEKMDEAVLTVWNRYSDMAFSEIFDSNLMVVDKVSIIFNKIKDAMFASEKMDDRKIEKFMKIFIMSLKKEIAAKDEISVF